MSTTETHVSPDALGELFGYQRLSAAQLGDYDRQGFLLLDRTLTDAGLDEVRKQCMAAWHAQKKSFDANGTWLQNALLANIHRHAPIVRDFYYRGPLLDVAGQLIGPNIKGAASQLTFKMRGNTQAFGWHQDNGYGELDPYNALTTLTALDDTDADNGCLWIKPGSHRQGQIDVRGKMTPQQKAAGAELAMEVDESDAIPMPMKAGQTLIFNCWMLHKSEGNHSADRDRRILFLRFADADAVEVYNDRKPRLGRLLHGATRFDEVRSFESDL